jgi:hypothetical protein
MTPQARALTHTRLPAAPGFLQCSLRLRVKRTGSGCGVGEDSTSSPRSHHVHARCLLRGRLVKSRYRGRAGDGAPTTRAVAYAGADVLAPFGVAFRRGEVRHEVVWARRHASAARPPGAWTTSRADSDDGLAPGLGASFVPLHTASGRLSGCARPCARRREVHRADAHGRGTAASSDGVDPHVAREPLGWSLRGRVPGTDFHDIPPPSVSC